MGAWGAIIMSFFGAAFVSLTLYWQFGILGPALALPFMVFAAIALAAVYVLRLPGTGLAPSERADRVIMWSSIGEGIGLFLAGNIVMNIHRPDLLLQSMALIIGLHFLPVGHATALRAYYLLGGALILVAVVGVIVGPPNGGTIAGLMGALGLWVAAAAAVQRDRAAKLGSASVG
jgi:hypothetical protein